MAAVHAGRIRRAQLLGAACQVDSHLAAGTVVGPVLVVAVELLPDEAVSAYSAKQRQKFKSL